MSTLLLESIQNKDAASPSIYINAAGNVGIGTTSPATKLEVASPASTSAVLRLSSNKTGTGAGDRGRLDFYSADNSGTAYQLGYMDYDRSDGTGTASYIAWANRVAGTVAESMRIDSLGKLLVGTTDTQLYSRNTGSGFCYRKGASLDILSPSDNALILNRAGSDGSIAEFRKDGTTVGSIGATAGSTYYTTYASGTTGSGIIGGDGNILLANKFGASTNGSVDLGASNARVRNLYLSGGVYLGGTGAANKLDDYEEGTWNPEIYYQNAGDQADATNNTQNGYYVKVGSVVTVAGYLNWTLVGTAANDNIGVKNFPFAAYNGDSIIYNTCAIFLNGAWSYPSGGYIGILANNQAMMNITDQAFGGNAGDDIGAGTRSVSFVVTYRVS